MLTYVARRILFLIPVAILVSFITFMLIHLVPGDPGRVLLGEDATPQAVAALDKQLGLDQPLLTQYVDWLGNLIHGNLGLSFQLGEPVTKVIVERLPVTAELGVAALLYSIVIAIPLGVYSATHPNSKADGFINTVTLLGTAVPSFVLALVLIIFLAVAVHAFPPGGYVPLATQPLQNLRDLVLPMVALGTGAVAVNLRQVRATMAEVLRQDYIRTARAKGLREPRVNYVHALRNAILPVITLIGLQAGAILGGAFVIETIFLWPGIGELGVTSILAKDYPVVQGVVLLAAVSYMGFNLIVDVCYGFLDPRISYGKGQ